MSKSNIRKAFNLKVNSLLSFLQELFEIEGLPDYPDVVRLIEFAEDFAT
ncbi:hypothetical protein [Microcoleus sp.]